MALQKVDYVNQVTVITAENMNDIQDAIIALETEPSQGLTEDVKQALLQLAQKVAYIDDQGQTYYQNLYDALYPPADLVSITAVYTQSGTVYPTTPLDDLKADLVVTGTYDDQSAATIPASDYSLSGALTVGTSTITVTSGGKTTTFSVTVTAAPTLSSITATYTQSGTVYDTDTLDSLKADLVVTAVYSDSSTQTVPSADYTLSGTLTAGTSTITVSYSEKTTTFNVTVSEYVVPPLHNWDFTQSLVDSVGGITAQTANVTQDSEGLHFTEDNSCCLLGVDVFAPGRTLEVDFASTSASLGGNHGRLIMFSDVSSPTPTANVGNGFIYRNTGAWAYYKGGWSGNSSVTNADVFSGHKLVMKYYLSSDDNLYHTDVYCDSSLVMAYTNGSKWNGSVNPVQIGSSGNAFKSAVITGARIYEGV